MIFVKPNYVMESQQIKFHVSYSWGAQPVYVVKCINGRISGDLPYFGYTAYKHICNRWVNKDVKILFRFATLCKPRLYVYPENWLMAIHVQRMIAKLKILKNKWTSACREPERCKDLILQLTTEIITLEQSLNISLLHNLKQVKL